MSTALELTLEAGHREGSLLEHIGDTPLLRLRRIAEPYPGVEIHAKAEFMNPGARSKTALLLA